jgi:hypothetical protein
MQPVHYIQVLKAAYDITTTPVVPYLLLLTHCVSLRVLLQNISKYQSDPEVMKVRHTRPAEGAGGKASLGFQGGLGFQGFDSHPRFKYGWYCWCC